MYRQGSLSGLGFWGLPTTSGGSGFLSSLTSAIETGAATVSADIAALRRIKIQTGSPVPILTSGAPSASDAAAAARPGSLPGWVLPVGAAALIGLLVMNHARKPRAAK